MAAFADPLEISCNALDPVSSLLAIQQSKSLTL